MSHRKRHPSPPPPYRSPSPSPSTKRRPRSPSASAPAIPSFPSYLDSRAPLPPKIRLLCSILATAPSASLDAALDAAAVRPTPADVEDVLKLSYSHPAAAVKFFRWAGARLPDRRHSPYAWNLVVDLLGKNRMFAAMWDAVASMLADRLLSLATFASVFGSFAAARLPDEAVAAFDAMHSRYAVPRDTPALNTLLSALCREGLSSAARAFLARVRHSVPPDRDTYAIILEGCENERDPEGAHQAFCEMVSMFGWDADNVPAYDSFLTTLVRSPGGLAESLKFLAHMKDKRCYPGMKFFRAGLQEFVKENDGKGALRMWDLLLGRNGCFPDTPMYNSMIALQCYVEQSDVALQFMEQMVMYGAFPDEETYNVMLHFLLKDREEKDAAVIFNEMVKNEFHATKANLEMAFKSFLSTYDWATAVKVWEYMVANDVTPLEDNANVLVLKLRDLDRLPEACKLAEDMIEKGIKLNSATLSKLKGSLMKIGKGPIYDEILKKWKGH